MMKKKVAAEAARANAQVRKPRAEVIAKPRTKLGRLEAMLRRKEGATIPQIAKTLGWQLHSVRGAIAGPLKRKQGLRVVTEKLGEGARVYRIAS